ncbi:MAG: PilZ domain-containing protein [Desulforhopalus sp.]
MKSKRSALRFPCDHQLVSYKTAYDTGEAQLINISTAGCVFSELTMPLPMQEKILASIAFPGEGYTFQAQGVVVRVENDCTAISFTLVEPEDQAQLRRHFARQMRRK